MTRRLTQEPDSMRRIQSSMLVMIIAAFGFSIKSLGQAPVKQGSPARPRQAPGQQLPGERRYIVQLGASFGTAEKANELTTKLRITYPNAHTQSPSGDETLYRVHIGPYSSREEARQVANELTGQGFTAVMILPW